MQQEPQLNLEKILTQLGENYFKKVQQLLCSARSDDNVAFLHDLTTFTNFHTPSPPNLSRLLGIHSDHTTPKPLIELLQASLQRDQLKHLLNHALSRINSSVPNRDLVTFRKSAALTFGISLLLHVENEFVLLPHDNELSNAQLFSLLEKIGRAARIVNSDRNGPQANDIFAASYILRYHLKKDISDLYYFWTTISPCNNGVSMPDLTSYQTRKLFDFLVFAVQQGSTHSCSFVGNFLSDIETIFDSIERHFPFVKKAASKQLTLKYFCALGILRESYRAIGNPSMVDRLNVMRLRHLAADESLTNSRVERFVLKCWGCLTKWGTSAGRIVKGGLILFSLLFVAGLFSSIDEFQLTCGLDTALIWDHTLFALAKTADHFFSYAVMTHTYPFSLHLLDHFFSTAIFFFYTVLFGSLVALLVRHN